MAFKQVATLKDGNIEERTDLFNHTAHGKSFPLYAHQPVVISKDWSDFVDWARNDDYIEDDYYKSHIQEVLYSIEAAIGNYMDYADLAKFRYFPTDLPKVVDAILYGYCVINKLPVDPKEIKP
ncbi:hypothetical protein R5Q19_05605 [Oenococcus oeni]